MQTDETFLSNVLADAYSMDATKALMVF